MSTPRTDALRARLAPLSATLSEDNFGEVFVKCIAESLVLCAALERELAAMKALLGLVVACGEACGVDSAYTDAREQMKAAAK